MRKIRVIVVDDSAYSRRTITKMLEGMENVEVVGYATDGEEGIRRVIDLKPDLVTLDLEMPRMDGFTLLRIIMNTCPTPVIVISSRGGDERVFKALELGAVDFIAKPSGSMSDELLKIKDDLQNKVKSIINLNMAGLQRRETAVPPKKAPSRQEKPSPAEPEKCDAPKIDIVAVGASTGGPPALQKILSIFAEPLPFSIMISQHMPPGFTKTFAERLNRLTGFEVKEAEDGDLVRRGSVLIAPGGKNMMFRTVDDEVVVRIVDPSTEDKYVPSVDAMFVSLAKIYGSRMLAIVLTGMGNDGSKGVRAVKAAGGSVLAESEESSVVYGMPREAIATRLVDKVAPLEKIAKEIMMWSGMSPHFD